MRDKPRPRDRARAALLAACAAALLAAPEARAEIQRTVSHRFERVWPTAVRYLRVDRDCAVREKDAEIGYVLFELKEEEGETFRGSLELVRTRDPERRRAVKLILDIEDRPEYVERVMMKGLLRKIRDEHGPPPPPPDEGEEEGGEEESGRDGTG